jgi:YD repeat-containing protein
MKKSLMFLSAAVLALSTVFISSCGDDDEGGAKEIPPALIKSITSNVDDGGRITTWEFTYDDQDRLTLTEVTDSEDGSYDITYDYSVAGRLTELEAGLYESVFVLDEDGRIIKGLWDASEVDDNFDGYEYDEDGFLIRRYYKEGGVEYEIDEATVVDDNITVHSRYDGDDIDRTKVFTYLPSATALNVSNLPQANLRNSERRTVSGLYGKGSKKLVDFLELNYVGFPEDYVKNKNTYTFNSDNQVVSIQRTGTDADGNDTGLDELFTYTYYPIEE